jgi:hypothetical protein
MRAKVDQHGALPDDYRAQPVTNSSNFAQRLDACE